MNTKILKISLTILSYLVISTSWVSMTYALETKDIFDPNNTTIANESDVLENVKYIQNLPNEAKETIVSGFIQKTLSIGALLAAVSVIAAAVYYMISMGNEDDMNKAKNILLYTLIGLAIVSGAYGLVIGVAKIQLF